jgi:hypothetical protein
LLKLNDRVKAMASDEVERYVAASGEAGGVGLEASVGVGVTLGVGVAVAV